MTCWEKSYRQFLDEKHEADEVVPLDDIETTPEASAEAKTPLIHESI